MSPFVASGRTTRDKPVGTGAIDRLCRSHPVLASVNPFRWGKPATQCSWLGVFGARHWLYSASELGTMLCEAGFRSTRTFGALNGAPYDQHAERLITVSRKKSPNIFRDVVYSRSEGIALKKQTEEWLLNMAGTLTASAILFVIGFAGGFMLAFRVLFIASFAESPRPLIIGGLIVGAVAALIPFGMRTTGGGTLQSVRDASRKHK